MNFTPHKIRMSANIPFDIQAEIMKKLPIKSLIQFRLVSKTWKTHINNLLIKHSHFGKKNLYKALIAAEYAAAGIVKRPDNFKMNVLESIKINRLGEKQDFVLETPLCSFFGINAIARYVASGSSRVRRTRFEFAQIEQWIGFSTVELDLNFRGWALIRLGYFDYDEHFEAHYIKKLKNALDGLNTHLASHEFLVGNSVTLADIITTCDLLYGFEWLMTKDFTSEFPHVEKYFWDMIEQPHFKNITGEVKQADAVIPLSELMKREEAKVAKPNRRRFRNLTKYPKEEAKPEKPS